MGQGNVLFCMEQNRPYSHISRRFNQTASACLKVNTSKLFSVK
ncbi:protein of unknown function [Shewanella benthica]|uniref:Uncharacterized protein n=1 Tax=Shewanella benthica TaxID=43661 RepID=A0A330M8E4_9GAMM|nr:protein of unknown function [Shewanella benthica]